MYFLATFLLLGSLQSAGQDTVYALPEMTVTATRLEADVAEIGQRIERIDRSAITLTGSRSLADVLARNSSVYVRRYGPAGIASVSLRGTGASQTTILLDGRRIGDPQLGQLDISLLPVDMLSSVEVMHGAASAVHGSDGIGGAVNLRTDDATEAGQGIGGAIRLGAGEFGEREFGGRVSFGDSQRGVRVAGRVLSSENDYPYYSRALGQQVRVEGASREEASVFASAHARSDATTARMSTLITSTQRGLPAGSGIPSYERQEDDAVRVWADVQRRFDRGFVKAGGLVQHSDIRYQNSLLQLDELGRTLIVTGDVEAGTRIGLWNLILGSELSRTSASHPSVADIDPEIRLAAYAQAQGFAGPVNVYPSVRVDRYVAPGSSGESTVRNVLSPAVGINVRLSESLRFRTSAGRSFRMPTFNDRFWSPGGNPHLRPERGWSFDGALILASGVHRADVTAFLLDTRDQIVWSPISGNIWAPSNLSHTVVHGIETSARTSANVAGGVASARASYRFASARDRSDASLPTYGKPLRYRPAHAGSGTFAWQRDAFEVHLNSTFTGRTYTTDDASRWLDPYVILSAGAAYSAAIGFARLTLSGRVENLSNIEYAVVENRPMPPRHFRFSLQIESIR